MVEKIQVHNNKSLKLFNVLIKDVLNLADDSNGDKDVKGTDSLGIEVEQMKNYIKSKGAMPIGPLIQYTSSNKKTENPLDINFRFLIQSDKYINNIAPIYKMESVINIKNCMYARFSGEESELHIAYKKIQVEAYEKDIELKGDSYTVYVDGDGMGEMTVDIFMEKA